MFHYLVTGGAGFIGSHLTEALLKQGRKVRVLDNLSTGKRENVPNGAELAVADITDLKSIEPFFEGIDGVFHLAAAPSVQESIENPLKTHKVNVTGTLNIILACKKAGVKRIVYSSSAAVYGDQQNLPIKETAETNPLSPYGLHKLACEHYMRLASMFWSIQTVCLRYFNVFGPRMPAAGAYASVISVFLRQKARNEPLTIVGDGSQTRDFVYVSDVAAANLAAMENSKIGGGETINIGGGQSRSVSEIARLIGGPAKNLPPRIEIKHSLADISLAQKLLNWRPGTAFAEGIKRL